ncbi:MAG TPA: helix-turn-helix domain-containing protein [Dehalococcoidia bacterium]|nr:helix-turn-helix domain-containing protein [Dehalococcoidia bacterium]
MARRGESAKVRKSYGHPCLIAQALDLLGDRWTLLIIRDLMTGLHRYSEVLASCSSMSPNVLSDRLKRLEAEGLVTRNYERGLPPKVEYHLTDKGWAVKPILVSLLDFSREHVIDGDPPLDQMPVDFVIRVVPTFAFQEHRAQDVEAVFAVEIDDCGPSNIWSFRIENGKLLPKRGEYPEPDLRLRTSSEGFLRYIRGSESAEQCGEVRGSSELARAVQECFASSA